MKYITCNGILIPYTMKHKEGDSRNAKLEYSTQHTKYQLNGVSSIVTLVTLLSFIFQCLFSGKTFSLFKSLIPGGNERS